MNRDDELGELVADGGWLRGFVGTLVARRDTDDVVQATWLAAWQSRTRARGPLRSWLCGIAGNLSRLLHRQRHRAASAVARCAHREPEPAAGELVAGLEVQRLVSEAMLALPEPTRTILVLRYQQDLAPAAIAARVGLEVAAVRQRLHRGREAVRARLQDRFGSDWRGAVGVVAFLRNHGVGVAPASMVVALGAFVVASLCVVVLTSASQPGSLPVRSGTTVAAVTDSIGDPGGPVAVLADSPAFERTLVAAAQDPAASPPKGIAVRGRVVAADDRTPLAGVRIQVSQRWPSPVAEAQRPAAVRLVTGADGTFAFECDERAIAVSAWFEADARSPLCYDASPPKGVDLGDVRMQRGYEVRGRVVDEAGQPTPQLRLELPCKCDILDGGTIGLQATTDHRGEFRFRMPHPAGAAEFRSGMRGYQLLDGRVEIVAKPEPNEFLLRCRRLPFVSGVVFDAEGRPCGGLELAAVDPGASLLQPPAGTCLSRPDGSFTIHRERGDSPTTVLGGRSRFGVEDLVDEQPEIAWDTAGVRVQARPHADVTVRVVDAESRKPIERFSTFWTKVRGQARVGGGGGAAFFHDGGTNHVGRMGAGTHILVWSEDPARPWVEVAIDETMRGPVTLELALTRMRSCACEFVDAQGRPIRDTFHLVDRRGQTRLQPWSDPRGGRSGTDVYRVGTVVSDAAGKGELLVPTDGRDLVLARSRGREDVWLPFALPARDQALRIVVPD